KRCPNPRPGEEGVLEIRPCYALEDLAGLVPKVEFQREVRLRKQVARQLKPKSTATGTAKHRAKSKAASTRSKPARRTLTRQPRSAKAK
ncbi:MAG TPA: hypothetical protein VNM71_04820, partial [Steroidobacteraceae bacterium]|nr:hypothetical protein [Steroidobacteraceae bacterium]